MRRGDIYFVELPNAFGGVNSVERGRRPVVVVSSDIGCRTAPVVMVAPLTTKIKRLSCNVDVNWTNGHRQSQVLCNQLTTIPKAAFTDDGFAGYLSADELSRVDDAILISLGLIQKYSNKYKGDVNNG